jgi:hypothetical protein
MLSLKPKENRTMFTHSYKNGYIHGYFDKPDCLAQIGFEHKQCRSYRAAQIWITRQAKQ